MFEARKEFVGDSKFMMLTGWLTLSEGSALFLVYTGPSCRLIGSGISPRLPPNIGRLQISNGNIDGISSHRTNFLRGA